MSEITLDNFEESSILEAMEIDAVNAEMRELAALAVSERMAEYADELDMEMLLADPRFYGPDFDDGANDCDGFWYWELM